MNDRRASTLGSSLDEEIAALDPARRARVERLRAGRGTLRRLARAREPARAEAAGKPGAR